MTQPKILSMELFIDWAFEHLLGALIAALLALWIGVLLARKQARAIRGENLAQGLWPPATFADYGDLRFLHLGTPAVQGSMRISKPFEIHLEYVQRMMGWLLFVDLDRVPHLHAMQMGLGAASLTKFCHHALGMQTTAIELNPLVVDTCRRWFKLPPDNHRLQVILGNAADVASSQRWHKKIDVLQVDVYDPEAACPMLDSQDFYRSCQDLLTHDGFMAVNLFGHAYRYEDSLQKITAVFGADAVWAFKPTAAGNTIVLACRTARSHDASAWSSQAKQIEKRWSLPATKWLNSLTPIGSHTAVAKA
jgi:spermidine synthase